MIIGDGVFLLVVVGLWLFCLIDVITTPEGNVRNLQKTWWVLIVLFFFEIGAIVWLVAGRDWNRGAANLPYKGNRGTRPVRATAPSGPPSRRASNPDDDEEFLAGLRARAEEQRRRARETERPDDSQA